MPVFGQNQKKPKNLAEGLGLETTGGTMVAPPPPTISTMAAGGMMGSLTEQAMERKKMNSELGGPTQMDPQGFFNNKKKKRNANGGFTNETGGFGQAQEKRLGN